MKIYAAIPARGGSKGIPGKNVRLYAGKPLVQHSIDQALRSQYIQRVIVSTDSPEIAHIAKNGPWHSWVICMCRGGCGRG